MSDFVTTDIYIHNKTIKHIMVTSVEFSSGGTNPTSPILTLPDICVNTIFLMWREQRLFPGTKISMVWFVHIYSLQWVYVLWTPSHVVDCLRQGCQSTKVILYSKLKTGSWKPTDLKWRVSFGLLWLKIIVITWSYGYSFLNKTKYTTATLEIAWLLVNPILKALVMHI